MKISIIIPARDEHPQATFTLQSIWAALEELDYDWETILVANCCKDLTGDFTEGRFWDVAGRHHIIKYEDTGSAYGSMNRGADLATGDILFFFDAHVILSRDYFPRMIDFMTSPEKPKVTFSPIVWMGDTKDHAAYGYSIGTPEDPICHLREEFWGHWRGPKRSEEPFPVPMSGSASMAVDAAWFREFGRWPEPLPVYNGGEQWISLLSWMLGETVWMHPQVYTYHYDGSRGPRGSEDAMKLGYNDGDFFSRIIVAYALGGEKWWQYVLDRALKVWEPPYHEAAHRFAKDARELGEKYREWVEENALFTLDEVLEVQPWAAGG
ncbi:MAG: glycosyltransferase family 2 protein [Gammaproteobacteria bacterium]|nr:glycosyltransferase family 2 protein [Gammaproteobacteria bacterium]